MIRSATRLQSPFVNSVTITIEEGQRQAILLALAHLAVERPGWKDACLEPIALLIDNQRPDGKPELFTNFYLLRMDRVRDSLPDEPTPESLNKALAKWDDEKTHPELREMLQHDEMRGAE